MKKILLTTLSLGADNSLVYNSLAAAGNLNGLAAAATHQAVNNNSLAYLTTTGGSSVIKLNYYITISKFFLGYYFYLIKENNSYENENLTFKGIIVKHVSMKQKPILIRLSRPYFVILKLQTVNFQNFKFEI